MTKYLKKFNPSRILVFSGTVLLVSLSSCTDDLSILGNELLPGNDKFQIKELSGLEVEAYQLKPDSISTSFNRTAFLGSYEDAVYGSMYADFALQYGMELKNPNIPRGATLDSAVLYIHVNQVIGNNPLSVNIYRLNDSLASDSSYLSTIDAGLLANKSEKVASGQLKAEANQLARFTLSNAFALEILSADTATQNDNEKFVQFFKGLYFEPVNALSTNTLMGLTIVPTAGKEANKSKIVIYYKYPQKDSSLSVTLSQTEPSNWFTHLKYNHSGTKIETAYSQPTPDTALFLQSLAGAHVQIRFKGLDSLLQLKNVAILKAELIVPVDTLQNMPMAYPAHAELAYAVNPGQDGIKSLIADENFYDHRINKSDNRYLFNLTAHIQKYTDRKITDPSVFIYPVLNNSVLNRIGISNTKARKMKLRVVYSELSN